MSKAVQAREMVVGRGMGEEKAKNARVDKRVKAEKDATGKEVKEPAKGVPPGRRLCRRWQ